MPSILKRLSREVSRLRKQKGWSQDELAKQSGLHRTYIGSIEREERNISIINLQKIAKALGVKPSELIKQSGF